MAGRWYQVVAEGLLGRYDAGVVSANTKRSAIRQAQRRYRLLARDNGWDKTASDFFWSAEPARALTEALPPEDVSVHR
jgi:hypothetical protein